MTQNDFVAVCVERLIDPALALENDDVVKAIKLNDVFLLIDVLDNQL